MYYRVKLSRKVRTDLCERGSDVCVCRAPSAARALSQLLPSMRAAVVSVDEFLWFRDCYPNPDGILKERRMS